MNAAERFVKICGEVGNFRERLTGISVVDAYFGPEEFHPKKQSKEKTATDLIHDIHLLDCLFKVAPFTGRKSPAVPGRDRRLVRAR